MAIVFNGNIMNGRLQNNRDQPIWCKNNVRFYLNNKQITYGLSFDSMPENEWQFFTTVDAIPRYLILGMYINR